MAPIISLRKYEAAKEIIKKYEEQQAEKQRKKEQILGLHPILIDDVCHDITLTDSTELNCLHHLEFHDILLILLNPSQHRMFLENDTCRSFFAPKHRIEQAKKFLTSPNNIWRNTSK